MDLTSIGKKQDDLPTSCSLSSLTVFLKVHSAVRPLFSGTSLFFLYSIAFDYDLLIYACLVNKGRARKFLSSC